MIRLYVIEDHELIVDGLRNRFRPSRDGIGINGFAHSIAEAIHKAKPDEFDIIILDLWIPGTEPIENVSKLKDTFPDKSIIILTYDDSPFWKFQMYQAGVKAYLVKNADRSKIKSTIEEVYLGETVFPESYHPEHETPVKPSDIQMYQVKPSEKKILTLVASGIIQKEIAERTGKTLSAVEKTLSKIRKRFKVRTNSEVVHILTMLKEL